MEDIKEMMAAMGKYARRAATQLALLSSEQKNGVLYQMAQEIEHGLPEILSANAKDVKQAQVAGLSSALLNRLALDEKAILSIAESVRAIAALKDPVGEVVAKFTRPNGLSIERVRTPLGVIGIIYESRPNVTVDAGALCFKSGNAALLRGGSDAFHTSQCLHNALVKALEKNGIDRASIQLVSVRDRAAVGEMLSGLNGNIDVLIPRGGKSLVARVQKEARVPVFAHLEGICHVYVDKSADLNMAHDIILNAKMRRTAICGAAETLLIDRAKAAEFVPFLLEALVQKECEIRASEEVAALFPQAKLASEEDFATEYLDAILSVACVDGVEGAISHIQKYSSHHTEAIITEDEKAVQKFFHRLDSAILMHNTSTQFADGGEFGFGAEIGIATGKMHARGPIGVEQLTSFQYHVRGAGQIRP